MTDTTSVVDGSVELRAGSVEPIQSRAEAVEHVFRGGTAVTIGAVTVGVTVGAATLWTDLVGGINPVVGTGANLLIAFGLILGGLGLVRVGRASKRLRQFGARLGSRALAACGAFGASALVWAVPTIIGVFTGPHIEWLDAISDIGLIGMVLAGMVLAVLSVLSAFRPTDRNAA